MSSSPFLRKGGAGPVPAPESIAEEADESESPLKEPAAAGSRQRSQEATELGDLAF